MLYDYGNWKDGPGGPSGGSGAGRQRAEINKAPANRSSHEDAKLRLSAVMSAAPSRDTPAVMLCVTNSETRGEGEAGYEDNYAAEGRRIKVGRGHHGGQECHGERCTEATQRYQQAGWGQQGDQATAVPAASPEHVYESTAEHRCCTGRREPEGNEVGSLSESWRRRDDARVL